MNKINKFPQEKENKSPSDLLCVLRQANTEFNK